MSPGSADAGISEHFPLSPLQHGMLFHAVQSGRSTGVDVEQLEATLHEPLDADRFARAWRAVAGAHPTLRARFAWEGLDAPRQEVLHEAPVPFELRDLSSLPAEDRPEQFAQFLRDDRTRGFDLHAAPLWRVTLFRYGPTHHRMVWTYSHAILDACFADVVRDVFEAYDALARGVAPEFAPRPSYRDHILWLQDDLRRRDGDARAFWRARLAGFATPTSLDAVQTPTASHAPGGHDTLHFALGADVSAAIRRLSAAHDLRVSTFVEGAWAIVLGAFAGERDVVFGATRSCRRSSIPHADTIIGLFINTVPVRVQLEPGATALALLQALRRAQVAVREFEHTPLVDVLACADVPRGTPLFDTIVVFNDRDNDARLKAFGGAFASRDFVLHDQTNFPFNVMAYDEPSVAFKLSFDRARFGREAAERIADLLRQVLESFAAGLDARVADLPRLPAQDAARLQRFNETAAPVPEPPCVHAAFEAQADRTPDAAAVVFRGASVTYRELDERANRVAAELVRLGVGPDRLVGVFVERSIEMVVGLLGILKAGGAYVPLDPAYPRERVATMIEDARASVVLTLDRLRPGLPATPATVLSLDAFGQEGRAQRLRVPVGPEHLAYVIFTSGSTGRPKGVQIEHRNVANFFGAMDAALGTTPGVWLALTSISFDISVLEIFWTLARGFTVVVQEEVEREARAARPAKRRRPIGFSLFYFAAEAEENGRADRRDGASGPGATSAYHLLIEGAKFADTHGFEAVWTPERHFHPFGGLYPNPAVTSAAVAAVTTRIAIRAGSIVLPLHNPIRCAEEWSVVDNLSNGRVGLSFASGWHASDFALAPGSFKDRRELMAKGIDTILALWRGEAVETTSGDGSTIQVRIYPRALQARPRVWITASGNPETFAMAGRIGASVLTNLLVMTPEELTANAAVYREAYKAAGHPGHGHISLMLHTYVGETMEAVRAKVRGPFLEYLRTSTDLVNKARWERTAFAKADGRAPAPGAPTMDLNELPAEDMAALLDHAFERYFATAGLFGTPQSCVATVDRLRDLGVDEIACLIDFGVDGASVLAGLPHLDHLRRLCTPDASPADAGDDSIPAQIRRHGVTHLQCTPSLLGLLAMEDDALDALGSLRQLLVGGEALSPALVERLRPHLRGTLRNMYGPTETTIWSTTTPVRPGAGITIGRPIANTTLHVVDRDLRPVPLGVPGELLIGGAGVARGYLQRPELTAERFVSLRTAERLYRTGDLARWLPSGEVEFLGRLDHQVKIRGYRIELGEIESVIAAHPAVQACAVVAHQGPGGDARLFAYVAPRAPDDRPAAGGATPGEWEAIWDDTYREAPAGAPGLDLAGWKSSFTGERIAEADMRDWVERTTSRIQHELRPGSRVLEIGCGTGMFLVRLAPLCAEYVAVDVSDAALGRVRAQVEAQGIANVRLQRLAAHELASLDAPGPFDVIVLNSVIQYFPGAAYLSEALTAAFARLAPGGVLFVGDVRSRQQAPVFYAAVEWARASRDASAADVAARARRRAADEGELLVDPRYFEALARQWPGAVFAGADTKAGQARTEMHLFRYDAVIRKTVVDPPAGAVTVVPAPDACTADALRDLVRRARATRITGLPNRRLWRDAQIARALASAQPGETVDDVDARVGRDAPGVDPDELRALDPGYAALVEFSDDGPDRVDATFVRRDGAAPAHMPRPERTLGDPAAYASQPAGRAPAGGELVTALRQAARLKLPEYMVPAGFVVLDALPLTPNGKIDRKALPAPEPARRAAVVHAPATGLERTIVGILSDLVGGPGGHEVSVDDNFFDVGINSLLMVQASVRLRTALGRPVPLVQMFQFPTARSLADALGQDGGLEAATAQQSQERAQLRRDAMQRRRGARPTP